MRLAVALIAVAAACGDDDASDQMIDAGIPEDGLPDAGRDVDAAPAVGSLAVTWTLARDESSITCGDVGLFDVATIEVVVTPVDGRPALMLDADCAAGGIDIDNLPAGTYLVRAESPDASSDEVEVEIVADDDAEAALVLAVPSGARFTIAWSIGARRRPALVHRARLGHPVSHHRR
jgi:hypothetical protein